MHILISLMVIVICIFEKISCSLLSRLKNRYEYTPQENNTELFTEDLYDFEFTNIESSLKGNLLNNLIEIEPADKEFPTNKVNLLNNLNEIDHTEEDLYTIKAISLNNLHEIDEIDPEGVSIVKSNSLNYLAPAEEHFHNTSQSFIIITNKPNYKRTNTMPSVNNFQNESTLLSKPIFLPRPTIKTSSSSNHRKTWATHFPRKTLPLKLDAVSMDLKFLRPTIMPNINNVHDAISVISAEHVYKYVPTTVNTSSSNKARKTWATYFPRKTLLLNSRKSVSSKSNTTLKNIERSPANETIISYCYRCGLNESRIPTAFCYNTFEGGDKSLGRRKHRFKIKCIRNQTVSEEKKVAYGPSYRKGCFKRFLDVGVEYNERGCRTVVPTRGKSFASKRFASLENLLKDVDDGCVFSPHASITPFSRAISLFARYHVCVCRRKYCNRAETIQQNLNEYFILILCTIFSYIYNKHAFRHIYYSIL